MDSTIVFDQTIDIDTFIYESSSLSVVVFQIAFTLFSRAARLTRIDILRPARVIGTNTVAHLQSGLYFGYVGLVDGILARIVTELGCQPRVVATGGLARMIAEDSRYIAEINDMLTLDGLRILFERNRST